MFTKNIIFKNFKEIKFNNKLKKILVDYSKTELIKSFSKNYQYSFDKIKIKKYMKFQNFNLIGMGGSSLGTKAIYSFLNNKIKKIRGLFL